MNNGQHQLEIVSLGLFPAAVCSGCERWGFTFTRIRGDTGQTVKARLEGEFKKHVEQAQDESKEI